MKVSYIHGLESPSIGPKSTWLHDVSDAYIPSVNYKDPSSFERILNECKGSKLIIGSSMGGYFSYLISQHLGIPTLLFNPAVIDRTFDPSVRESDNPKRAKHIVYLGKKDNVISGSKVKKWFSNNGIGSFSYTKYDGGHRVPYDVFIDAVSSVLKLKEQRVKTFESFHNNRDI